jgi:hypothetical protein
LICFSKITRHQFNRIHCVAILLNPHAIANAPHQILANKPWESAKCCSFKICDTRKSFFDIHYLAEPIDYEVMAWRNALTPGQTNALFLDEQ